MGPLPLPTTYSRRPRIPFLDSLILICLESPLYRALVESHPSRLSSWSLHLRSPSMYVLRMSR